MPNQNPLALQHLNYTDADRRMQAEVEAAEKRGERFDRPSLQDVRMTVIDNEPKGGEAMRAARLKKEADDAIVNWQVWLKQTIRDRKGIQLAYNAFTHLNGVCPFLNGLSFNTGKRYVKTETDAMTAFMNSTVFEPWREHKSANAERTAQQKIILDFLEEFLTINYIDQHLADNWATAFGLLQSAGFIPQPLPVPVTPEPEEILFKDSFGSEWTKSAIDALSAADQASLKHQMYVAQVVGYDEHHKPWTEEELDALPDSKQALRLRRLFEKGNRGDSSYDLFLKVKDKQAEMRADLEQRVIADAPARATAEQRMAANVASEPKRIASRQRHSFVGDDPFGR